MSIIFQLFSAEDLQETRLTMSFSSFLEDESQHFSERWTIQRR